MLLFSYIYSPVVIDVAATMRDIKNLKIKLQLTNEYLRSGGLEKIYDPGLIQDMIDVRYNADGTAIPDSVTTRLNAFMLAILQTHLSPPVTSDGNIAEYASFVQKDLFFEQQKIETVEQVNRMIAKHQDQTDYLFRGQREARWRLYSTLQRSWIVERFGKTQQEHLDVLQRLVKAGRETFQQQISQILGDFHLDSVNDISVLGYLQHHNCPTPLLDWTYDFKTALFFAVDGLQTTDSPKEIDRFFSVYFIDEKEFDDGSMRSVINHGLKTAGDALKNGLMKKVAKNAHQLAKMKEHFKHHPFFDKNRLKGSGLVQHMTAIYRMCSIPITYFSDKDIESGIAFSITNSENIKKQSGVFTWNADAFKPLEVIGSEQYETARKKNEPEYYRFCHCYNVSKQLTPYILKLLTESDMSRENMYPDKDVDAWPIFQEVIDRTKGK